MTNITDGLTPTEDNQVVDILKKWNGGILSDKLFTQLAKMIPQTTIETVILRKNNNLTECLLIPRPENDIAWPNTIHSPGSALRSVDFLREDQKPLNGPLERIQKNELMSEFLSEPVFVANLQYLTKRGPENVMVFYAELKNAANLPINALWVNVEKLDSVENLIKHHLNFISIAARAFNAKI